VLTNSNESMLRRYTIFPSDLGWFALAGCGAYVERLSFGHATSEAARRALAAELRGALRDDLWFGELVERLQAYADGARDDFRDVLVDYHDRTRFQVGVAEWCRRIPPGVTVTYGQLAAAAGRPAAARAVGSVMRTNPVPLIVPCHRVVAGTGKLHAYSAADGIATKRRLLEVELQAWITDAVRQVVEI
jgi:methylated-DNA-[protein]-cysteine S-methyltransferase